MENLHKRLKEEIDRLRLSLETASKFIGDKTSQGLRDACSGRKRVTAELIAKLIPLGVDSIYVLTGDRIQPPSEVLEPEEKVLLNAYRELSDKNKKEILISILAGGSKKEKKEKGYAKTEVKGDNISNSGNINSPINSDNMDIANNSINIGNNISGGKKRK